MAEPSVEIIYADALIVRRGTLVWRAGLNAADAIAAVADIAALGATLDACGLAVWGIRVLPEQLLQPGDRLEIMPPLPNDPKDSRRQRVVDARTQSRVDAARKVQRAQKKKCS